MFKQETLPQYVSRILKEKQLTVAEVEQRAGEGISKSYVCSIANGDVGSLTVRKLKALARGLGVLEDELFAVARGIVPEEDATFYESRFGLLFRKYEALPDEHKREVLMLLELVDREIERRSCAEDATELAAG